MVVLLVMCFLDAKYNLLFCSDFSSDCFPLIDDKIVCLSNFVVIFGRIHLARG